MDTARSAEAKPGFSEEAGLLRRGTTQESLGGCLTDADSVARIDRGAQVQAEIAAVPIVVNEALPEHILVHD